MMKLLTGALMLFVCAAPASAATIHLTMTNCRWCEGPGQTSPSDVTLELDLWLTVEPTTGEFFYQRRGELFQGTQNTVTALEGTMNDAPVSLGGPSGFLSWGYGEDFSLALLVFTIGDGNEYRIFDDGTLLFQIRQPDGYGTQFPISWQPPQTTPVSVPDASSSLLLIALSMASFAGLRRRLG